MANRVEATLGRLRELVDVLRRRTHPQDKDAHEMMSLAIAAGDETVRQQQDISRAWADADTEAWREYAKGCLQSLVIITGIKAGDAGKLVPNADGVKSEDVPAELARLANAYAEALLVYDVARRKGEKVAA
jgi:hypothetical protein